MSISRAKGLRCVIKMGVPLVQLYLLILLIIFVEVISEWWWNVEGHRVVSQICPIIARGTF